MASRSSSARPGGGCRGRSSGRTTGRGVAVADVLPLRAPAADPPADSAGQTLVVDARRLRAGVAAPHPRKDAPQPAPDPLRRLLAAAITRAGPGPAREWLRAMARAADSGKCRPG